jgi:hypothetical protein
LQVCHYYRITIIILYCGIYNFIVGKLMLSTEIIYGTYTQPKGPLFHQDTSAISLLSSVDAIALFNPGFGHAYLQQSWAPTLKYLYTCKIPILCTALSQHDLDRELDWLHQLNIEQSIQFEFVMRPLLNPFRSLRLAIDDKEKNETNRIIGTNQYVYIIKGK